MEYRILIICLKKRKKKWNQHISRIPEHRIVWIASDTSPSESSSRGRLLKILERQSKDTEVSVEKEQAKLTLLKKKKGKMLLVAGYSTTILF